MSLGVGGRVLRAAGPTTSASRATASPGQSQPGLWGAGCSPSEKQTQPWQGAREARRAPLPWPCCVLCKTPSLAVLGDTGLTSEP